VTSWTDLVAYNCRSYREGCINDRSSARARARECAHCVSVSSLESAEPEPATEPPTPSGPSSESMRYKRDRGARTPVSEPEERSDDGENTALLETPRDSASSGQPGDSGFLLLRLDGGEDDATR